ncbi:hypothetical protein KSP40_PGU005018 [Platanthera guangdongensis]|uniref:Transmembrane protein n=1 Tax=Platanthera guangdongensis TaxID=2320717 RepID=A0ABR2MEY0_9ASPA
MAINPGCITYVCHSITPVEVARGSKPKPKPKERKTEEEKTFRRRAKYFLGAQLVAVLVFLSLFGGGEGADDLQGDEEGDFSYED